MKTTLLVWLSIILLLSWAFFIFEAIHWSDERKALESKIENLEHQSTILHIEIGRLQHKE